MQGPGSAASGASAEDIDAVPIPTLEPAWAPNLFLIGAPKCATTAIADRLLGNPNVYVPERKEHHVFSGRNFWQTRDADYTAAFHAGRTHAWRCDASTSYCMTTLYSGTAERMQRVAPDARILFCVRDPLPRLVSHFREEVAARRAPDDFVTAVQENPELLGAGRYVTTLDVFESVFGDENVRVLFFEDFTARPDEVMTDIAQFLALDDGFQPVAEERRNTTVGKTYDGGIKRALMSIPGVPAVGGMLPLWFRRFLNRHLTVPVPGEVEFPDALRRELIDQFAASEWWPLLARCGRERELWPSLL